MHHVFWKTRSYYTTGKKLEFGLGLVKKSFVVGSCLLPLICLYIWCIFKHANSWVKLRHYSLDEDFMKPIKYKKWVSEQEIMMILCEPVILFLYKVYFKVAAT